MKTLTFTILFLLLGSALFIFMAPSFMPLGYSSLQHSISESAAQGLNFAWIARLGFLLFGVAVWSLAVTQHTLWNRVPRACFVTFALCMLGTAAFSHKPWLPNVPFDETEDILHSITATLMGFAFSFGVLFRLLRRQTAEKLHRLFDILNILAAVVIPLLGVYFESISGLVQRLLFILAYLWFAFETITLYRQN